MNKFFSLTKVIMKCGFGESTFGNNKKKGKKKQINSKVMGVVLALCFIPLFVVMISSGKNLFQVFSQAGATELGYQMVVAAGSLMLLIFAIPYVMAVFFMSSDINTLLALPIKPSMILGAKFASIVAWQYLFAFAFVAPLLIGYNIAAGAGAVSWIIVALTILTISLTPTVYASFFAIVLVRSLKNVKNKEMITTMSTMVVVFASVGMSLFAQSGSNGNNEMLSGLASQSGIINGLSYVFPNIFLLSKALDGVSIVFMLLYLLTVAAVVGLFLVVGEKLYIGGATSMRESSANNKLLTIAEKNKMSTKRSQTSAIVSKELKTLFRSPEYLLNCLIMPIIMPIMTVAIMAFAIYQGIKMAGGEDLSAMMAQITGGDSAIGIILIACLGMSFLVSSMNMTTVTCISREGKGFINMKYIPVSYKTQIKGKLKAGEIIGLATVLPVPLVILVAGTIALKLNPVVIPIGIIGTVVAFLIANYFQMLLDLFSPKLSWETEQGAVKQNFNTFISVLAIMFGGGMICVGLVLAFKALKLPVLLFSAIAMVVLVIVALLMRLWVYKYGCKKLADLE